VVRTQEPQPIQGKGKNTLVAGGQPDQDQGMTGYYPDRAGQMRQAVTLARRAPGRDPDAPAPWEPSR
jgi:hypothetical protein